MESKIRNRLEEIRSFLQADGGDLEIVEIDGKTVKLRLVGACGSCHHAMITLKDGIEKDLREQIDPEILVERVQD
ncbi:MAG TPA: NifU family protein [Victivallales bacterium]|nr:NifU family protein [Victivallales bacterium]